METYVENGLLHRDSGPAVIHPDYQEWYCKGKLHRSDGPARMFLNHPTEGPRVCEVWLDGRFISQGTVIEQVFNEYWFVDSNLR